MGSPVRWRTGARTSPLHAQTAIPPEYGKTGYEGLRLTPFKDGSAETVATASANKPPQTIKRGALIL